MSMISGLIHELTVLCDKIKNISDAKGTIGRAIDTIEMLSEKAKLQEYNSDCISRKKLIEDLFYSAYGNRYSTRDCDNFPITISLEDLRKIIYNQPQVHPIVRTQADRIRNMSDEELAELIDKVEFCKGKVLEECEPEECNDCAGCCSNTLAWLQSEVKEVRYG